MLKHLRTEAINRMLFLGFLGVVIFASVGFSQQQQEWVYRYDNGYLGKASAIAYGADGNIYVAGTTTRAGSLLDFTIISLYPNGDVRWVYYSGLSGQDEAFSIVYGADGNIYACGYTNGGLTGDDLLVISLTSDGLERWVYTYDHLGSNDRLVSICYGSDGNLYASGFVFAIHSPGGWNAEFAVISLPKNPPVTVLRWFYIYSGGGPACDDRALSIIDRPGGYVYVAGYAWYNHSGQLEKDAVVISLKKNAGPQGEPQWISNYDHPVTHAQDTASCIVLGADNNLYVAGLSRAPYASTYDDILVWSLDTLGNTRWDYHWDGGIGTSLTDWATRIVYGKDNNLYLSGCSQSAPGSYTYDFIALSLVKDNPTTPRWAYRYPPDPNATYDCANSIVHGLDDNIYVAGQSGFLPAAACGYFTMVSLYPSGTERWVKTYGILPGLIDNQASDLVYGADAGVYYAGKTRDPSNNSNTFFTAIKIGIPNCLGNGGTHPSQARHLMKDPFTSNLHAVFEYDNKVYYRMSTDYGNTWGGAEYLGRGSDPSICLAQSPFFAMIPCVVYCDIDISNRFHYHWGGTGSWQYALLPVPGRNPLTPSIIAAGAEVYIGYALAWEFGGEQQGPCIMCKRLMYYDPLTQVDELITGSDVGDPDQPSLGVDNNYGIHAAWHWNNGYNDDDIAYSYRDPNTGIWTQAAKVRDWPSDPSMQPFCEFYGDSVFVVWGEFRNNDWDVWRAVRRLPDIWSYVNVSNSPSVSSESPTKAGREFAVWAEQIGGNNYDIKYCRFKPDGNIEYGFVEQNVTYSYWPHSQYEFMSPNSNLYSLRTEDNNSIFFKRQQFTDDTGDQGFYMVETGKQTTSPYCTKRDSFISYPKCPIDIGRNELAYELSFLDPAYSYKIRAIVYHEGIAKSGKISLDGKEIALYTFPQRKVETLMVWIPQELYRQDHKVTLRMTKQSGDYAIMGPITIHQYAKRVSSGGGGGAQSSEITDALKNMKVKVGPTISRKSFVISYNLPTNTKMSIQLYDITGRMVMPILTRSQKTGGHRITVDTDKLANGVYFLRFENSVNAETRKVVVSK